MSSLLLLLLGIAVIAIVVLVADLVMRRIGVDAPMRFLADLVVLIAALLLIWPRLGW